MKNSVTSVGTTAEKSTKVETQHPSSHSNGNTHVGSSLCPSTQELFPIHKRRDLSVIDYHFSVLRTGDNEVRIPYVPLYDYLRCVEMLQAAEYQISVLQEAVSNQSQVNQ
jgi:hypothetical protein